MQRARASIAATLLFVLAACSDQREPAGPGAEPAAIIYDGSRNDDADDFFFLPPVMPDPSRHDNFDAGKFNAGLRPTVSICQLAADPKANPMTDCALSNGAPILIADFPSSAVSVSTTAEHYQVNWHTDDSPVLVDRFYRIQVFLGSIRVGFADIDPVSSARELKSAQTNEVIPLVDGRTLPIKFRVEQGALCENKLDCGEFTVTDAGGTFLTNTKYAGVQFQPGFLPPGVDQITLTIERVAVGMDNQCHGASNPRLWKQWEACYSFTTDPDLTPLGGIQAPATVGKCTELSTDDPLYDKQLGYKSRDGVGLVALPNVTLPVSFGLDCEGFMGSGVITQASNPILRFAQAGWRGLGRQVGRVFGVRPAYAIDLGLGDRVRVGDGFSHINWGIGLDGTIAGGGEQSVPVGTDATPLELLIEYSHIHTHSTDGEEEYEDHVERMGGVPVVFQVTTGNGYFALDAAGAPIRTTTVMTSIGELDLGIAAVAFTADPNALSNVVTATAPTLDGEPFLFNITGQPSDLIAADLVRSVDAPTTSDALSWGFAIRNTGAGTAIASTARLTLAVDGSADGPVATREVAVPSLAPGAAFVIEAVEAIGPLASGTYIVNVTADHPALVVEGSETNNAATETFTVADPPDLTVASFTRSPAFPTTADAVTYTIQISNIGGSTAPASTARITTGWSRQTETGEMEAGGSVGFLDVGEIAAGAHLILELPQGTLNAATHSASIVVDIENGIAESNEANNSLSLPSFVVGAATLVTMSGQVTDLATGAALPGATVSIVGTPYAAVTNVSGLYQITNVPAGTYTVSASFIGYQTSSRTVTVAPGMPGTSFQLTLMPPIDPGGDGGILVPPVETPD